MKIWNGNDLSRREFLKQSTLLSGAIAGGTIMQSGATSRAETATPPDLVMMNALDLSRAIKTRSVSCAEVMSAYLNHIERVNPKVMRLCRCRTGKVW
jgi:amidase